MNKNVMKVVALWVVVSCLFCVPGYAENPGTKLGRGVCNIITSPVEFLHNIKSITKETDPVAGFFGGIAAGAFFMVTRIAVGVYEVVTFAMPLPGRYEPVMNPPTPIDGMFEQRW